MWNIQHSRRFHLYIPYHVPIQQIVWPTKLRYVLFFSCFIGIHYSYTANFVYSLCFKHKEYWYVRWSFSIFSAQVCTRDDNTGWIIKIKKIVTELKKEVFMKSLFIMCMLLLLPSAARQHTYPVCAPVRTLLAVAISISPCLSVFRSVVMFHAKSRLIRLFVCIHQIVT